MSGDERETMARRKKLQGALSVTTSALGLTALGTKGGSYALRQVAKHPKVAARALQATNAADKMDKATIPLLTTGAGIGGVGGFNFAAIQRAEAKREKESMAKKSKLSKGYAMDRSAFGVQISKKSTWSESDRDRAYALANKQTDFKPGTPDPDDWKREAPKQQKPASAPKRRYPSSGGIDPERRRLKRLGDYQSAATTGAVVAGAGAAGLAGAGPAARKVSSTANAKAAENWVKGVTRKKKGFNDKTRAAFNAKGDRLHGIALKATKVSNVMNKVPHSGRIAAGAGIASAALAGTAVGVNRHRKGKGRSYADWWDG